MSPFDGYTYNRGLDQARLHSQLHCVYWILNHPIGKWWTLSELAELAKGSEAGVSARVRDLRKKKFGGHSVQSRRRSQTLWEYRLVVPVRRDVSYT